MVMVGFHHRLIGVYAPWNPGGNSDDEHHFWPENTHLCNLAKFSWSLHGDLNATLMTSESSSMSLNVSSSCITYSHFLNSTDGIDLWRTQAECDVNQHYTHCTRQSLTSVTYSIIDHTAISQIGTLSGTISIMSDFVPCTDHRPIDARIMLLSPPSIQGAPDIPLEVPPSSYSPRFCYPFRSDKVHFSHFANKVDNLLSHHPSDILNANISSDEDFHSCYDSFTLTLLAAAKSSFVSPWPHPQTECKITNPTITLILHELHQINQMIGALAHSHNPQNILFLHEPWVLQYLNKFFATHTP